MKPTTKILLLLACSVSPVPVFPITGATPIPPTNSLDFLPSLPTRDIRIVDGGLQVSSLRPGDSIIQGRSYNVDTERILFPRVPTDSSSQQNPTFPQLTLRVFDANAEAKLNKLTGDIKARHEVLQQNVINRQKDLTHDLRDQNLDQKEYEARVHDLIFSNDQLLRFEFSLIQDRSLSSDDYYRPKLIYTTIELLNFFRDDRNSKKLRDYTKRFIKGCVDLEAIRGKQFQSVNYGVGPRVYPQSIMDENFTGDKLLVELVEELAGIRGREGERGTHSDEDNKSQLQIPKEEGRLPIQDTKHAVTVKNEPK